MYLNIVYNLLKTEQNRRKSCKSHQNPENRKFQDISRIMRRAEAKYTSHEQRNFFSTCLDKFSGFLKFHENISKYRL